jgi:hypothetical protein
MDQISNTIVNVYNWARQDFQVWPTRFVLEITAWFLSIGCAVTMALTLPHPPFLILYPLFIVQCIIFAWAAWTRRSTGMLANYLLLVSIDTVGLARLIFFT